MIAHGRRAQRMLDEAIEPLGITVRNLGVLGHLRKQPNASISELARRANVTAQSMRTTVSDLQERGLLILVSGGRGRRSEVRVSEHGDEVVQAAIEAAHVVDRELLAHLSESNRGVLVECLTMLSPVRPESGRPQ